MAVNLSTEEEYNTLPLGDDPPAWRALGRVTENAVIELCKELSLSRAQRFDVLAVWNHHPDRAGMF